MMSGRVSVAHCHRLFAVHGGHDAEATPLEAPRQRVAARLVVFHDQHGPVAGSAHTSATTASATTSDDLPAVAGR